jgi:hypothetical protein
LLVTVEEMINALLAVEPGLYPVAGVKGLTTIGRRARGAQLACCVCRSPFEPVFLGGEEIERCYKDEVLWFDVDEHDRALAAARGQHADPSRREPPSLRERLVRWVNGW